MVYGTDEIKEAEDISLSHVASRMGYQVQRIGHCFTIKDVVVKHFCNTYG